MLRFVTVLYIVFFLMIVGGVDSLAKNLKIEKSYESVDAFVGSFGDSTVSEGELSFGDINGDGIEDAVLVIHYLGDEQWLNSRQLFFLKGVPNNQYSILASSKKSLTPGMGCCWLESIEVVEGSVEVQNWAKTHCGIEIATHVFRPYQNTFQIVQARIMFLSTCGNQDETYEREIDFTKGEIKHIKVKDANIKKWKTEIEKKVLILEDYDFMNFFGLPELSIE